VDGQRRRPELLPAQIADEAEGLLGVTRWGRFGVPVCGRRGCGRRLAGGLAGPQVDLQAVGEELPPTVVARRQVPLELPELLRVERVHGVRPLGHGRGGGVRRRGEPGLGATRGSVAGLPRLHPLREALGLVDPQRRGPELLPAQGADEEARLGRRGLARDHRGVGVGGQAPGEKK